MLNRHMSWPPADFAELSVESQQQFWTNCHEVAQVDGRFNYSKVRSLLIKKMAQTKVIEQSAEDFTEPKPLEVWENEGWDVAMIEENGRKVWNSVAGWLYEVPLTRTSRSVTLQEI